MLENDTIKPMLLPYQELDENVWRKDICAGCRACIAVCLADTLAFDPKLNRPSQIAPCVDCGACLDACPRLPANIKNIVSSEIIGPHLEIKNVRSKTSSERFQNGGAVTALLSAALDEDLVDCALVMGLDRWAQKPQPRVVHDAKDLEKCAGSVYTSNAVLEAIKDIIKDPETKNIALVGTPCTVQAVGLLRRSSNEYALKVANKIRFLIGLFCFEAFDDSLAEEISGRLGVQPWRINKMIAANGMLSVSLRDGSIKTIPLSELAGCVKPGCRACADFTAKQADISVGSIGSAPGMSTVIVRSDEGMGLFKIAEEGGFIEVWDGVRTDAIEKAGNLKLKRNGF
ncbi:MAG: Coenzyme F420 hydrogenase subunit beta [Methanosaeta sp. PtaU1.Bin060]|nr:MAG: Coenzyme F420 hydrogenase subunit beta [Methanosaeta sp. PtaU1.Bin060]